MGWAVPLRAICSGRSGWVRKRLAASARSFSATAGNPSLLRAQLAFGATWTAEAAFTVAIAVVAFGDGGAWAVGLVAVVRMAPSALVVPVGMALADRFPRDRVLLVSCLVRATATLAAASVLVVGGPHVAVYGLAIVSTVAFRLFRPAHSALLPGLCCTPFELSSANVVRGLLDSLSMMVGPLAAALLLALSGPVTVFVLAALLSGASGALLVGLPYEAPTRGAAQPLRRIAQESVDGFRALVRYRDAGIVIGLSLAQSLTQGFLNVFVVVLALEVLGMGDPGVGLLVAAVGAGAVTGSLGATTCITGRRLAALMGIGVILWGLPITFSGAFPYEPVVLGLMCVIGLGNVFLDIGLHTLPARLVPEELHARVFGTKASLGGFTAALGAFIAPVAIALLGIRGAMVLLGLVAPALTALAWHRLRAIDAAVAQRDERIEVLGGVAMLRPLPIPAIDGVALRTVSVHVAADEEIVRQGDEAECFYVIEAGEAEVIGNGRLIRTLQPGTGFGEIALLKGSSRTATVRARTPLRLYRLDRHEFVAAVRGYESSSREAEALMLDRLSAFAPARS